MGNERDDVPRHESVDHEHPTDAGLMDDDEEPGTGIMGDETVVRPAPEVERPGIALGTVGDPHAHSRPSPPRPRSEPGATHEDGQDD